MVLPKPRHLGFAYALQFSDPSVARAYRYRLPYPPELLDILRGLMPPDHQRALDLGCGSGDLTLGLLDIADEVDGVDISAPMIEIGRRRPGGGDPRLRWILGSAETAPLRPPYGLITAAESLHWMDWYVVMPRLEGLLAPSAVLTLCQRLIAPAPWNEGLGKLLAEFSTNTDFRPTNLVEELAGRGLFSVAGSARTALVAVERPVDDYIESIHSGNGFSRDRMPAERAAEFDARVRELTLPFVRDGVLAMSYNAEVTWGRPHGPEPV